MRNDQKMAMDGATKYMSNSPVRLISQHPLHLDFFQPGQMDGVRNGIVHHKTSPHTIIAQVLEGGYEVLCNGQKEFLNAGDVFLVPADCPVTITHHDSSRGRFRSRWIHMRFSWMGVFDYLLNYDLPLALRDANAARLGRCMGRALVLRGDSQTKRVSLALEIHSLALRTLHILCGASRLREISPIDEVRWQRLNPVLQSIREHPAASHTVPSLAQKAHLSASQFYEVFRAAMGISPMQHVWKVRLERAGQLLLGSDHTLGFIAEATGFADAFHFSHKFRKAFGISPSEFRKQARSRS